MVRPSRGNPRSADSGQANTYRLGLKITNIAPDAALIAKLASTNLPPLVPEVYLDAHASLTAPIDRHVGTSQPRLTALAQGEIAMRVKNWRIMPQALVALGLIQPTIAPTLERALQVMAARSPDINVLDMTLRARDGWVNLGPLPLGPAPKFN
mgnify:CR=1 FL=1